MIEMPDTDTEGMVILPDENTVWEIGWSGYLCWFEDDENEDIPATTGALN